jgi:hypothetical protein
LSNRYYRTMRAKNAQIRRASAPLRAYASATMVNHTRHAVGVVFIAATTLLAGCTSDRVLLGNFNTGAVGSVPPTNQDVGTFVADEGGGAGTVRIAAPPPGATSNWVEIRHPGVNAPQVGIQGRFNQFRGDGTYGLLCVLFIPTGAGVATVQFEPTQSQPSGQGSYLGFLHLDFMPNNTVRIDDTTTTFGTFPRDQFFTLSVNLSVGPSSTTAEMSLFGTGASGSHSHTVPSGFLHNLSRQFNSMRFWMGAQHTGSFKVDEIIVSYSAP